MNRIRLLPEQVANQIAAGEVIERPASIVKELVENSLDAQAARITIEIQAGGRSLVRVIDDGLGMSRDDALLCLERHATSKIQRAEDLAAVRTMGFRGEALPSIASVSRFTLITRERHDPSPEGSQVAVSGGKILEVKSAGCAPGTRVEVRQLFFNLPARRKFLRTEETEYAHIHHYVTVVALAYPEVAFTLVRDGRVVRQVPAVPIDSAAGSRSTALRERLRALYGTEEKLTGLDTSLPIPSSAGVLDSEGGSVPPGATLMQPLRIWGFLGVPGVSRATREDQHLFVNRRPVENRMLNAALLEGYHTSLMKGRYPVCCLFLELDPAEVDVNIHPTKREVRFHNDRAVRHAVSQAVRQSLLDFHQAGQSAGEANAAAQRGRPAAVPAASSVPANPQLQTLLHPPGRSEWVPATMEPSPSRAADPLQAAGPVPPPMATSGQSSGMALANAVASAHTGGSRDPLAAAATDAKPAALPLLNVALRLVGVVGKLYVVLESDRGLVLLDQHAAHERILFEQMLTRLEQGASAPSQRLLLAETVELSVRDAAFVRELLSTLTRLGVGLSEFGERTFLLDALPPFVCAAHPRDFVLGLIAELKAAGEGVNPLRLGEHVVAKSVCRHAVKAHDPLAGPELEKLLADLRQCAMPYTCPHGRPTLIEMSYRELERKFGRQT